MLPVKNFIKTNFVDGIKFNPQQIQQNDEYYDAKMSLSNAYGIGVGILVGYMDSLRLTILNGKLVLKPGALIDSEGNLILVQNEEVILDNIMTKQFNNKKSIYVYIKYTTELDELKESKHNKDVKLHYKIEDKYIISIEEKNFKDKMLFELGRIFINHSANENIKTPTNPYAPKDNEINIKFAPKVIGKNHIISHTDKRNIIAVMSQYANFLNELSYRKSLISSTQPAAFAYKIASDINNLEITPWELYDMLFELLNITLHIYNEKEEVVNTALWKNVKRLQSIFNFSEKYEVDYYYTYLDNEMSFFSKVIMHYDNASIFDGNWDDLFKDDTKDDVKDDKGYLLIGSGNHCDIVIDDDNEDIANEHAKLYKYKNGYFIEDMKNTSGVYINAEKLEIREKRLVRAQDFVVLGKNGKILNLNNPIIKEL
jgi:hypothetical protein